MLYNSKALVANGLLCIDYALNSLVLNSFNSAISSIELSYNWDCGYWMIIITGENNNDNRAYFRNAL